MLFFKVAFFLGTLLFWASIFSLLSRETDELNNLRMRISRVTRGSVVVAGGCFGVRSRKVTL